ncbi:MAG: acyl-CoA thioester hydrolase [Alteromonadaceae bacterium]|jgi:acyl-CoA thioester hydrolase
MFTQNYETRFSDTDALGHINNTMVPIWFEGARDPIFRFFTPDLNVSDWKLILAKIDVEFHAQMFYPQPIQIRTWISHIGNSSFNVYHELWQDNEKRASGNAVMVHFCHQQKKAKPIPDNIRDQMADHVL